MKLWHIEYRNDLAAFLLAAVPSSAFAMDAQTFYMKALVLKEKGTIAVFSRDLRYLVEELKTAGKSIKAENKRAAAAGKPLYCNVERRK